MLDLAERAARTEGVVKRFRSRPFSWKDGRTCIHLARAQMRALGHRPPGIPRFQSAIGARRALAGTGHDNIGDMLDAMLPRIAPLAMIVGDLAAVPGEAGLEAVAIYDGSGALLMYHADADGLVPVKEAIGQVKGAWRV